MEDSHHLTQSQQVRRWIGLCIVLIREFEERGRADAFYTAPLYTSASTDGSSSSSSATTETTATTNVAAQSTISRRLPLLELIEVK